MHVARTRPALETVTIIRGPFEIVAAGRRVSAGGFPNTSGNPFATIEVTSFSVRDRGAPVTITYGDRVLTSFWRVAHLPHAIAFSPGRTQYATIGSGQDWARQGAPYEALLDD